MRFGDVGLPVDAHPKAGKADILFSLFAGVGDFIFICFVGHSAPFLYSDCLNTPARWLDSGGKKLEIRLLFDLLKRA